MKLIHKWSEDAIRALTYLAQREGQGFQSVRDMAGELGLAPELLAKVLRQMVKGGMLESRRDAEAFRLAQPAASLTLFQIVHAHEDLERPRVCLLGQAECSDERACPLHDFWKTTSEAYRGRLLRTTLREMVRFCQERPASGYPRKEPL